MPTTYAPDPMPSEPRRFPIRLPRPLWIGLAITIPVVMAVAVFVFARQPIPRYPNATLCLARVDGDEFGWCGLQDSQSPHVLIPGAFTLSMQPKSFKFVDKDKGTKIQIEWRLLRSTSAADSYEFKITTGSNAIPSVKRIDVSSQPVELLRADEVCVTVKDKVFDKRPPTPPADD